MTYIKVFVDWLEAIEPLSDAERGRLFTRLLEYAKTGEVPKMKGNERFLFPVLKMQIDRDSASYDARCEANRANGRLGGRPRKDAAASAETEKSQEKEEDKEKEKDKDFSKGAGAPGEKKWGRKKAPAPRRESPEDVAAGKRRMEKFLLELRREAAEQTKQDGANSPVPPWDANSFIAPAPSAAPPGCPGEPGMRHKMPT